VALVASSWLGTWRNQGDALPSWSARELRLLRQRRPFHMFPTSMLLDRSHPSRLELDYLPLHLVVIGGAYVGLENGPCLPALR
jgi:hypothetical protein